MTTMNLGFLHTQCMFMCVYIREIDRETEREREMEGR